MRVDKKLDGIADIRDESDRTGLRIVIELKKDVDGHGILNYLYKNSDLQISYNFNMIAIHNRRPTMMTLPLMLDAYITHQKEVVTKRSEFDLQKAKDRLHIVDGLMKALSILDEVIKTIRASKDKRDAKDNLISQFAFTEIQAEAIVSLQLYRLTNTDITELQAEEEELRKTITELSEIINNEKQLIKVIKSELLDIKKKFKEPRRSDIEAEIEEIKITLDVLVPSEEVFVTVTKDGYVKRTSTRSHAASNGQDFAMKESDYLLFESNMNTQHHLLLFTNKGNYIYQPVHELPDIRWKDLGQHISSIVPLEDSEEIIKVIGLEDFKQENIFVLTATKHGQIKRSLLSDYAVSRYSKSIKTMNLKNDDEMIHVSLVTPDKELLLTSYLSYTIRFDLEELPVTGVKTGGVKGMNLKENDHLVSVNAIDKDQKQDLIVITHRGAIKRMNDSEIEVSSRAKRGVLTLKELKANPHRIYAVIAVDPNDSIKIVTENHVEETFSVSSFTKMDRYSNGSLKIDVANDGEILFVKVIQKEIQE